MLHPSHLRHPALLPARLLRTGIASNAVVTPTLIAESTIVWLRWAVVAGLAWMFLLFPTSARPDAALLAMTLAIGNTVAFVLLRSNATMMQTQVTRLLCTLLEWCVAIGVVMTMSHSIPVASSMLVTVLLLPTITRYRMIGVVLASCLATSLVALWAGLHLAVYDLRAEAQIWRLIKQWTVALLLVAIALALLLWSSQAQRRWNEARRAHHRAALVRRHELELAALRDEVANRTADLIAYKHLDCGLTPREWEILQLLADDALTYKQIGARLFISPGTVKVHIRNMGEKFGVSGRRKVLAVARERGLLPIDGAPE